MSVAPVEERATRIASYDVTAKEGRRYQDQEELREHHLVNALVPQIYVEPGRACIRMDT